MSSAERVICVQAVCISACGNFGLVGFANSSNIGLWNMQSGIRRRMFALPGVTLKSRDSHISGIALDALNKILVVSTLAGSLFVSLAAFCVVRY